MHFSSCSLVSYIFKYSNMHQNTSTCILMILRLILQHGGEKKKLEEGHDQGKRVRTFTTMKIYIRTQLYNKNITHLSFPEIYFSKLPIHLWERSLLCGKVGGNQSVSIETVQHNRKEFNFGPHVC